MVLGVSRGVRTLERGGPNRCGVRTKDEGSEDGTGASFSEPEQVKLAQPVVASNPALFYPLLLLHLRLLLHLLSLTKMLLLTKSIQTSQWQKLRHLELTRLFKLFVLS